MAVARFKINIPGSELDLLRRKLELARLPINLDNEKWGEKNGVTVSMMHDTLKYWLESYDWRKTEAILNEMPQYRCPIEMGDFGTIDLHFVHSPCKTSDAIPLLFLHGWPGSFLEVQKILPGLNEAGFHVVAPSLPGYGFSSYPDHPGFKHKQTGQVMQKLMYQLGYSKFVVQGGDWGSDIARTMGCLFPDNVKAVHLNFFTMPDPEFKNEPSYTEFEKKSLRQREWFYDEEFAYSQMQKTKPRTLGFAMHDSPIAMLSWMADKLYTWSDSYQWSADELITWTLLHYFPGPSTAFTMYRENDAQGLPSGEDNFVKPPTGVSAFGKELEMVPRSWANKLANVVFWQEHPDGGHFAAYERPAELLSDLIRFYRSVWSG